MYIFIQMMEVMEYKENVTQLLEKLIVEEKIWSSSCNRSYYDNDEVYFYEV